MDFSTSLNDVDYRQLKTGRMNGIEGLESVLFFEGFLIAVAYSAAIGGLATLVGTGPNIFVKGFTDESVLPRRSCSEEAFSLDFTRQDIIYLKSPLRISFSSLYPLVL
jgi:di/tricarboxylate transporter